MDRSKLIFTLVSLFLIVHATVVTAICRIKTPGTRLNLVISPILDDEIAHEIEIQWENLDYLPGDEFAIYTENPSPNSQPIYKTALNSASGARQTGLSAEFIHSYQLTFKERCLKYRVAWLRGDLIKRKSCLRTRPNWMARKRKILGPQTMMDLFIPGTHDSGAYAIYSGPDTPGYFEKYAINQDIDVLSQLIYGARYLDIRVGYYRHTDEKWWIVHGMYQVVPLKTVVDQVKTFLNNTEEIVIFGMHEFADCINRRPQLHHELVKFLEQEFADYISNAAFRWSTNLETIWTSRKRLIITYNDVQINAAYSTMWTSVKQQWGDVRNLEDLYQHLKSIETKGRYEERETPRSAMAQLTADAMDVILNRLGGLRRMAEVVNFNVTNWYSTLWSNSANIVAVDFLRSSGIVDVAIKINEQRFSDCKS